MAEGHGFCRRPARRKKSIAYGLSPRRKEAVLAVIRPCRGRRLSGGKGVGLFKRFVRLASKGYSTRKICGGEALVRIRFRGIFGCGRRSRGRGGFFAVRGLMDSENC